MLLNGKSFEIHDLQSFFAELDKLEKVVLSKDAKESDYLHDDYCVFAVATHAIGLPKGSEETLQPFIRYY